ncbi:MAG: aromatic-amino-acid transaminase [Planctomycetota bacterium]|jgi:aromatic-amino-acid transaminase
MSIPRRGERLLTSPYSGVLPILRLSPTQTRANVTSISTHPFASPLIPDSAGRPGDDPIFALNAEAQRRKAAGEKVINASLGALIEDDGKLSVMPAVFEAYSRVDPAKAAAYAPIAGDTVFLDAVIKDVFGDSALADRCACVATAGGTGALHHAIVNFIERGSAVYTSSYYWSPYQIIADHTGRTIETFEMFDAQNRFDLDAFERGLVDMIDRQGRALVIFNFPCHNPTGYSLDEDEWRAVAKILQREGERAPVNFLLDLAYARYGAEGSGQWVEWLAPITETCTLLIAWSASKAFAQYGSRVGALLVVGRNEEEKQDVFNALSYSCRGTWSNCNHLGILAITELLTDPSLRQRVDAERVGLVELLGRRVERFNQEARQYELRYPRYEGGFFVSVFVENANAVAKRCAELGVFLVPMDGAVRIALCSTPMDQIGPLVSTLSAVIEENVN